MRKILAFILAGAVVLSVAGCNGFGKGGTTKADYHIGVVTGTAAQSEDAFRGAQKLIEEYGSADDGGIIKHVTYPDNYIKEQEAAIARITGLADDSLMKAVIVNQAVPGTAEAFQKIREKRPDILLLACEPQEDPVVISEAADISVSVDQLSRGYLMVLAAKKMGADAFVHISYQRHMGMELPLRRKAIMEEACKAFGITFVSEVAPDPMVSADIQVARQYILEQMPAWVAKYGKNAAFFCTDDTLAEPLVKRVAELGAIFVESHLPSPTIGYPGAFGIDVKTEEESWPAILKKVEDAVTEAGSGGRMGTWAYSFPYTGTAGLAEFAKRVIEGAAELGSVGDLMDAFMKYTPETEWHSSYYVDGLTGEEIDNHVLLYQDTYVLGEGYLELTKERIPERYLTMN